jgi:hypothetical protein
MQGGDTCQAFRQLEKASPDSRYIRCEHVVCGTGPIPEARDVQRCEQWLSLTETQAARDD